MCLLRVKVFHCQLKGARAPHADFERVGQNKLYRNDHPDGTIAAEHIYAAELFDCTEDAACAGKGHERLAVDHVETVENIGVDGNHDGDECENHFLKFVLYSYDK